MNWLRFLHWLGVIKELVWTEDFDGEIRLCRVRRLGPYRMCRSIDSALSVRLNDDGTTSGKSYVRKWHPYKPTNDPEVAELERLFRQ